MWTLKVFENRAPNPRVKPTEIIQTFSWKSRWTMLELNLDKLQVHIWKKKKYTCPCTCDCVCTAYHILILFLELLTGLYIINRIHLKYSYLCKLCSACEYHGYFWFVHMSLRFDNDSKFWDITEANINTLFPVQVYIWNHRSDLIL